MLFLFELPDNKIIPPITMATINIIEAVLFIKLYIK